MSDFDKRLDEMSERAMQQTGAALGDFAHFNVTHGKDGTIVYLDGKQQQQYSHRNGETEPPTIEGWYFLKQHGNAKWATNPSHPLVSVLEMNHELIVWAWGKDTPVKGIKGRWWGPVVLPWQEGK